VPALDKACPDTVEGQAFVRTVAPPLALAMGRRTPPISPPEVTRQAAAVKAPLLATMAAPAQPLGRRRLQESFRAHGDRRYHGAEERRIPADNNLAARDRRPTVMARTVSFGSQSDAGAQTRGVLMSVLHTLKTRQMDGGAHRPGVLDQRALDLQQNPFPLRFPAAPT